MIHENTFKKVDFNGAKGLIFIGDKILVYRRDEKTKNFPLCIDLPGGGREDDESPFETLKRETKEEFGLILEEEDICFSIKFKNLINPDTDSYFMVTKPLRSNEDEIIFGDEGVEWMLMTPEEFIIRKDGIKGQQERVKEYLKLNI